MSCARSLEIDLAGFLANSRADEFRSFREHYPVCPECAAEVRAWTELDLQLRGPAAHPPAALLLRFEDEPDALAPERRTEVERHLESCASCRDELGALRRFDFEAVVAPVEAGRELGGARAGEWLARLRRWLWQPALAYALVLILLVPLVAERWDLWAERGFEPDLGPASRPSPASDEPRRDAPAPSPTELPVGGATGRPELKSKARERQVPEERPADIQRRPPVLVDEVEAGANEGPSLAPSRALPGAGRGEAMQAQRSGGVVMSGPEQGSAGGGLAQQGGWAGELAEARKNLRPVIVTRSPEAGAKKLESVNVLAAEDAPPGGAPRVPEVTRALESFETEALQSSRAARSRFSRVPSEAPDAPLRVSGELDQTVETVTVPQGAEGSVALERASSEVDLRSVSGLATPAELAPAQAELTVQVLETEREGDSVVFRVPVPTLPGGAAELEVRVRHADGRRQLVELVRVAPSSVSAPVGVPTAWLGAGEHHIEVTIPAEPPGARRVFSYVVRVPGAVE